MRQHTVGRVTATSPPPPAREPNEDLGQGDGTTDTENLVLLCSRHHHVLHQPGWHAKLRPDGTFEVTDAGGIVRETSPQRAESLW